MDNHSVFMDPLYHPNKNQLIQRGFLNIEMASSKEIVSLLCSCALHHAVCNPRPVYVVEQGSLRAVLIASNIDIAST